MKPYKIVVAYQGTAYAGWQSQPNQTAIANVLQHTFFLTFNKKITLIGASRTDAGVHAHGQVATFVLDQEFDTQKMLYAWNNVLPADIVIRSLEEVSAAFNARYDVLQKTYWYHFFSEQPLPPHTNWGYFIKKPLDFEQLDQALTLFVGKHDFRAFASDIEGKNPIRVIESISRDYNEELHAHRIIVRGRSFLHCMIRRIVGACLQVARGRTTRDQVALVLASKNPNHALPNAPAQGLVLHEIMYKQNS